jgi:hypothetical protein
MGGFIMKTFIGCVSILATIGLTGCALVPDMPPDLALPMKEIVLNSACELQRTLKTFDVPQFARFKARKWLITVALSPKTDTDITPAIGGTRKVPPVTNVARFITWAINSPGIQLDVKGERSGSVAFNFKSAELIDDKKLPCDFAQPSYHSLAQYLGIHEWLVRAVDAMYMTGSAEIDKPTYNTDITIKFSGNGSYTYTFPKGTNLASLSGSYSVDEQLNITFAPLNATPAFTVVTLPLNGKGFPNRGTVPLSTGVENAQVRTDLIQIEQALRKLPQSNN